MITVWLLLIVLGGEGVGTSFSTLEECEVARAAAMHATDVTDVSQCLRIDVVHK